MKGNQVDNFKSQCLTILKEKIIINGTTTNSSSHIVVENQSQVAVTFALCLLKYSRWTAIASDNGTILEISTRHKGPAPPHFKTRYFAETYGIASSH